MSAGYLMWVRGLKGPEAQKWAEPPRQGYEYWRPGTDGSRIIKQYAVSAEEYALSIVELAAKHPPPVQETSPRYIIAKAIDGEPR